MKKWDNLSNMFKSFLDKHEYSFEEYCENNDYRVRIKTFALEVTAIESNVRFDDAGNLTWQTSERLIIEHDRNRAHLLKKDSFCQADTVLTYMDLDTILLAAQYCMEQPGWAKSNDDGNAQTSCRYSLRVQYYNGPVICHRGVYNRSCMPEAWIVFIKAFKRLINRSSMASTQNMQYFCSHIRPGEVKYCSISFYEDGKTYFYRTCDTSIEVGDEVIVPVGPTNTERIGVVEAIEFYNTSNVPYPIEDTKEIIRKT
jgi:hypothetical protein